MVQERAGADRLCVKSLSSRTRRTNETFSEGCSKHRWSIHSKYEWRLWTQKVHTKVSEWLHLRMQSDQTSGVHSMNALASLDEDDYPKKEFIFPEKTLQTEGITDTLQTRRRNSY